MFVQAPVGKIAFMEPEFLDGLQKICWPLGMSRRYITTTGLKAVGKHPVSARARTASNLKKGTRAAFEAISARLILPHFVIHAAKFCQFN